MITLTHAQRDFLALLHHFGIRPSGVRASTTAMLGDEYYSAGVGRLYTLTPLGLEQARLSRLFKALEWAMSQGFSLRRGATRATVSPGYIPLQRELPDGSLQYLSVVKGRCWVHPAGSCQPGLTHDFRNGRAPLPPLGTILPDGSVEHTGTFTGCMAFMRGLGLEHEGDSRYWTGHKGNHDWHGRVSVLEDGSFHAITWRV